uniref:Phosphoribosylformylglycinamidine synthase n=1 Tax=Paulinella longichromatophora TaxID=1708747 RepID=A0A2H4ZNU1_9EUKA|nr:phosphoribosylformylglycinamidine synthase [Paulinella longichromatophora]
MTIGIVVFPGSNSNLDIRWATEGCLGIATRFIWYQEVNLNGLAAIILPGEFNYGGHLPYDGVKRFLPILQSINTFAQEGGKILGICNGFHILTEMGLLPGSLIRNQNLHFICQSSQLEIQNTDSSWMKHYISGQIISLPIAHGKGRYHCSKEDLRVLEDQGSIALRYKNNPNGSISKIAGITNYRKNILGLMPHPERACDPVIGGIDGRKLLLSLVE